MAEYEKKYGSRGTSEVTTEQVPLSQTCGRARVIDIQHRHGATSPRSWPKSPEIRVEDIQQYEKQHGELKPNEIVIFHSGFNDNYCQPLPLGSACIADPLNGDREGWAAPGPEAILYLASKGIRCVATDGPSLGGSQPNQALMTYWCWEARGWSALSF